MRPKTSATPKAMLTVAGHPFVDWQLSWLAAEGVRRVVLSLGYLGETIERYVGDGQRWGLDVEYTWERDGLLGTAGAIRLAVTSNLLDEQFFVLYGDSYLQVNLAEVEDAFRRSHRGAMMTVFRNADRWDQSNVVFREGRVIAYEKNSVLPRADMIYIDYGLLVLKRDLIADNVPAGTAAELPTMLARICERGELAGFEVDKRFFEIGSYEGLTQLEAFLAGGTSGRR